MIFFGNIKDGKLELEVPKKFFDYIASLPEKRMRIKMQVARKIRSLDQNNLYWKWLTVMADELGYDTEELHASFKAMFLVDRSQKIPLVRSTTMLNTKEFSTYLDKIEKQASELNIKLPQPEEY